MYILRPEQLKRHITVMARWAAMLIRIKGENLGVVEAQDESSAIAKAIEIFNIGPEPRNRIVVTKLDPNR